MPWFAGVPRDQIEWFPTLDAEKCVGCGMCMNCGKNVFEWDVNKQKALAVRPGDCVVGCSTCRNLCRGNAISFPDLKELRKFYVKNRIWDRVKEELVAQGKIALPT